MGVQVTRTDSSGDFLPWDQEPRVTAVSGRVRIESQGRGPVQFSVWYLPVSCRQLERLLGALGNRPDMQVRLGGPEALAMVLGVLEPTEEGTPTPPGPGRVLTPRSATREAVAVLDDLEKSALVGIRERLVVNGLWAGGPPPRPGPGWQPTACRQACPQRPDRRPVNGPRYRTPWSSAGGPGAARTVASRLLPSSPTCWWAGRPEPGRYRPGAGRAFAYMNAISCA